MSNPEMNRHKANIAGIILAAGQGARIGQNKALLEIGGISFLAMIARRLKQCGCNQTIAVLGSESEAVRKSYTGPGVTFAINDDWEKGQFSSLMTGISQLNPEAAGALIALVDHPLVTQETYDALADAFAKAPGRIVIPVFGGRRGHPVVIPPEVIAEIRRSPSSTNLKEIVWKRKAKIIELGLNDPGIVIDIDTVEDLKAVKWE